MMNRTHVVGAAKAQPPLKWVGGKRKLWPYILPFVPTSFGTYFEPFLGGGAIFFGLCDEASRGMIDPVDGCVLSDANKKLIATYTAIRDDVEAVIRCLKTHSNNETHYYHIRQRNFSMGSAAERAAEFILLNKTGFNGLFRENSSGQFNVPFGDQPNATICDEANLRAVSTVLQGILIVDGDFAHRAKNAVEGDFVYFDPPYAPLSATSSFTNYTAAGFTALDQARLRDTARGLKARGVRVLISNSSAPLIRDLYSSGFDILEVQAARAINSKASARGAVTELLIT